MRSNELGGPALSDCCEDESINGIVKRLGMTQHRAHWAERVLEEFEGAMKLS